jgi:thioredoxin-like negative regulator of GroEL
MKLIKFGLPTCQPCKVLTEQMKDLNLGEHTLTEVNLFEDEEQLGLKYGIRGVPVIVVLDGDEEVERLRNISQVKAFLEGKQTVEGIFENLIGKEFRNEN